MSVTTGPSAPPEPAAPALADGVELIGEMRGSGYRTPPALVRRADGQVIQLTRLLYLVLAAVDGRRTHAGIAADVSDRFDRTVSAENVATLVQQQLLPLGLLRLADGTQPAVKKANPLLGLRFKYVVSDPAATRRITAPFAALFHPLVVALVLAGFLVICWWVLFEKGLASAAHEAIYQPGLLLVVFAVTVLSAGFHEFGHASAARYGGSTPGAMGMGLYLVWPAFYTDVTDSYRLGRGGRVRTDLGGLYFNAIVAVAMFGLWWVYQWDALLLVIATQVLQMIRQLAPLVRFDGYHVLADVTGVPDLYHHIKPILLGLLPQNWHKPETKVLKPWARTVVSVWVLLVVPLLVASLVVMVVAFPRVAATAWDSIGNQWAAFRTAFGAGDVLEMATRLLSIVAIGLPVFGTAYILVRLVRRTSTRVWAATEGKPAQRALAVVVALAIVAGLAWAWWPEDDRYRPIRSYERGTLTDVLPLSSAPAGLAPGVVSRSATLWPASQPLPTADEPALAVVLVPREGGSATASETVPTGGTGTGTGGAPEAGDVATADDQTWVFPFNRPPAPGEGDNQALAVNTEDGSTLYDVAFALVWAEGDTTDNVNSAYALASCRDCTTVAIAFQVVLVVGQSDTIVPQNLAAAVNYNCISCVTAALARQLVLTIEGPLSDLAMEELTALWQEIAAFGADLEGLSLGEIQARLTSYEEQIIAIIERDQGPLVPSRTEASASASPTPSGTAGPSASPGAGASPTTSGDGTTTGGTDSDPTAGEPSATTDSEPTTEPTPAEEPEPTPTAGATGPTEETAAAEPEPTPTVEPTPTTSTSP